MDRRGKETAPCICTGTKCLCDIQLIAAIEQVAEPIALKLDTRALNKRINADVSVQLPPWNGGGVQSAKFHHRPLYGQ